MEIREIRCDGCDVHFPSGQITFVAAMGHMVRYCGQCAELFGDFKRAVDANGEKYQRLLDNEEQEIRSRSPLKITPLDLPKLRHKQEPVVLA